MMVRSRTFGGSELFRRTYREGMELVEEAAAYLDGPGRAHSQTLPRTAGLAYAAESMRLTTRLMQVAAWLLVQRAVYEGDMSEEEAAGDKYRLGAEEICRAERVIGWEELPPFLIDLIERSESLYERVDRLDQQLRAAPPTPAPALSDQLDRVEAFFRENLERFPGPQKPH